MGFPLNAVVAGVIFRQRRLRNPRNTFWLGIIFCNLLALTNAIVEYVAFELMSPGACAVFRVTAGIPYTVISFSPVRQQNGVETYLHFARSCCWLIYF